MNNTKTLIITGMHRSGTSFTANTLKNAGLNVGKKLYAGDSSNQNGYFENIDFVEFHQKLLSSIKLHRDGWVNDKDTFDSKVCETDDALKLIDENSSECWGWKDPRTVLFLE